MLRPLSLSAGVQRRFPSRCPVQHTSSSTRNTRRYDARRACPTRRQRLHAASEEAATATPMSTTDIQRRPQVMKGITLLCSELKGLDFSQREVLLFLQNATKPPKAYPGFDIPRVYEAFRLILEGQAEEVTDVAALEVLSVMLNDLWRWRRMGYDSWRDDLPPHQLALKQTQGLSEVMEDPDKVSSLLLDNLNITDAEKQELSGATGGMIMAYVQSFVWGGVVIAVAGLIGFNFLRAG